MKLRVNRPGMVFADSARSEVEPKVIRMREIVVATDLSECSEAAVSYAVALAETFHAAITIAHIVNTSGLDLECIDVAELDEKLRMDARRKLQEIVARLPVSPDISIKTMVTKGIPDQEIFNLADRCDADAIVVGTHGQTGLAHLLLGSVAERIVRYAHRPVFVVRCRKLKT